MRPEPLVLAVLAAALTGCRSQSANPAPPAPAPAPPAQAAAASAPASLPFDATGETDSVWDYLAERYDADGDGTITPSEYDRSRGGWERLDRNEDGVLDPDDFGQRMGMMPSPAEMRRMHAQMLVAWEWQADDDPDRLTPAELSLAVKAYDSDGDGLVSGAEHDAAAEARREKGQAPPSSFARRLEQEGTWETLTGAADEDGDGRLAEDELLAFFHELDDGDGVWSLAPRARAAAAAGGELEGRPAPDFTLPLDGGEGTVTLSDHRGDRPVALIFGSYT